METPVTLQKSADTVFLALTIWREARGETFLTKLAVAYSILNRVSKPTWWGHDIMSVVFKKWQYSSMTAPNDPNLTKWPNSDDESWTDSLRAAYEAMAKSTPNPVPGADSYYDVSIVAPPWAKTSKFVGSVGRLRFFNVDNDIEASATEKAS